MLQASCHSSVKSRTCSERLADSVVAGLALTLLLLLVDFVDEADGTDNISRFNRVLSTIVDLLPNRGLLQLRSVAGELLNELEGVDHLFEALGALFCDCHDGQQAGLEAVLQHEGRTQATFKVKGD